MTSPLRKKRPTTVRGRNRRGRISASLLLLVCCLTRTAPAEQPGAGGPPPVKLLSAEEAVMFPPDTPKWLDPRVVRVQAPAPGGAPAPVGAFRDDGGTAYRIPFDLPGPERLFRVESEEALFQRMRQEARERKPEELVFPEEPVLSTEPYYGREWEKSRMLVEPHFLCHGRLFFEQLNFERYGWEVGIFQPLISTGIFYKDVVLLPFHYFTHPCRNYECNSGKCLPGDPVPFLLYPPELTVTGALGEAAVAAGLFVLFP